MTNFLLDYLSLVVSGMRTVFVAPFRQKLVRARFLALYVFVFPVVALFGVACLGLDHILFPRFRDVEVRAPIFIVGNWRTGSTFLHRTLARDTEQFLTFRLIDLFMPSLSQKRAMAWIAEVDAHLGGLGAHLVKLFDESLVPGYSRIHDMGLRKAEEDEFVFLLPMASASLMLVFPDIERFRKYFYFDRDLPAERRTWILSFYEGLIKRHLFHHGTDRIFVAKNPLFTPKIESLNTHFPDARFIHLVRSPLDSVPSTGSLLHYMWHNAGVVPRDEYATSLLLEVCGYCLDYPRQIQHTIDETHWVDLRFDELVTSPEASMRRTFESLGFDVSENLAQVFAEAPEKGKSDKSKHSYSSCDWGLSPERIYSEYRDYFETYGFSAPAEENREDLVA